MDGLVWSDVVQQPITHYSFTGPVTFGVTCCINVMMSPFSKFQPNVFFQVCIWYELLQHHPELNSCVHQIPQCILQFLGCTSHKARHEFVTCFQISAHQIDLLNHHPLYLSSSFISHSCWNIILSTSNHFWLWFLLNLLFEAISN